MFVISGSLVLVLVEAVALLRVRVEGMIFAGIIVCASLCKKIIFLISKLDNNNFEYNLNLKTLMHLVFKVSELFTYFS
jgi:hypothetical protein